jgi:hypothetical protein
MRLTDLAAVRPRTGGRRLVDESIPPSLHVWRPLADEAPFVTVVEHGDAQD